MYNVDTTTVRVGKELPGPQNIKGGGDMLIAANGGDCGKKAVTTE
jgi:hypothetical protein